MEWIERNLNHKAVWHTIRNLIIVRNVPCYKCTECSEVIDTADVVKRLENIVEQAKKVMQENSVIDYTKVA